MHVQRLDTGSESRNRFVSLSQLNFLLPALLYNYTKSTHKNKTWAWRYVGKNWYWGGRYDAIRYIDIETIFWHFRYIKTSLSGTLKLHHSRVGIPALFQKPRRLEISRFKFQDLAKFSIVCINPVNVTKCLDIARSGIPLTCLVVHLL